MLDIAKLQSLAETIEIEETTEGRTAYYIYGVAKEVFETLGLNFTTSTGKELTSQNFYNYAKNGSINGVKSSKQRFSDDEVEYFVAKMIKKAAR